MYRNKGSGAISVFTVLILGMLNFVLLWLVIPRGGELKLARFVNPSYRWIVYLALGMLLFFMFSELSNLFNRRTFSAGESGARSLTVLSLSVPLLFFLVAKDAYLTADIKEISSANAGTAVVTARQPEPSSPENTVTGRNPFFVEKQADEEEEVNILTIFRDEDVFMGQDVDILGLAETFPELGNDKFYLYRMLIVCCAADAQPIGLVVKTDPSFSVEPHRWYRVKGEVAMVPVEGVDEEGFLGLVAKDVTESTEPSFPFLF